MAEQIARNVGPAGIDVAYERIGHPLDPAVMLIMGGGAQLISWPDAFCAELTDRGLQVIRFDNRDTGHSTRLGELPMPDLAGPGTQEIDFVPYTLSDLAADTIGLLDALGFAEAHLVGASLGAMIAQTVSIEHPSRVRSLTSMMSSTGDSSVGTANPLVVGGLGSPPEDRAGFVDWQVRAMRAVGSPGFPFDERDVAERAARTFDRGYDLAGMVRQSIAVLASGDRTARLREVRVPALVIHGAADPMCDVSGGRATAAALAGAELAIFEGMGHSLPRSLWPAFANRITNLVQRAVAVAPGR
ncbi:alpha/beta fold hydrolase [Frankia sp. AgKG'84/4]|uniref:alpha/beta fold hydrolase n=1 Tax=Frankia sp. AgKG'84/4 TaxID=573490 RepID=UPI00201027B3|nr:alpha/beta hydrolase [Frankia sp. AgKG'84/4]MCL9794694.1 alpha/beta fold hydrolase [Frankia sp. AgKG'84/4]